MGSYNGSPTADLEYPLTFLESMARVLETKPSRPRFRCVHLSGKFVRQNQEEKLWFMDKPRKMKVIIAQSFMQLPHLILVQGLLETRALAFAETHADIWQTFIVKPGGVVPKKVMTGDILGKVTRLGAVLGENWSIRNEELGAFMTYLAIDGEGEDFLIENARIVRKGRELLESQTGRSGF
jgi:hypothetical protein